MIRFLLYCLSCITFSLFLESAKATAKKEGGTIVAIGIDLGQLLETNRSTVRVAASLINGPSSLTDEVMTVSEFRTIAFTGTDALSDGDPWHLFQEAYQYETTQCTNLTSGFSFNNDDPLALEERLIYLFKHIKRTTLMNYGYPKGEGFAVIIDSIYNEDSRSFIKAAASRAGLATTIVTRRNIALTMICPDSTIEDEQVYLELYLENNSIAIALVLKDEDGIFDTLANERVNYTTSGLDDIAILSSTLDKLMQNAQVSADTVIRQVIIASSKPLTVSHHRAIQHIQTFLKSRFGNKDLVFCGDQTSQDGSRVLPFEHRVAYGAATYSRSIAQEQLWNDQHICCVELSPVHYGIAVAGGLMHPIIRLHSIEDGPKSAVFTTFSPQQKQGLIEIAVYRGLRLQTASNTHVGSAYLDSDGSLSQLNMTIQVDHSKDELTLTVQDLLTGQTIATSTFANGLQTIASELEEFERNWSPEQSDLNRFLDQQLKDSVDSAISRYVSTATDTLQERLFKKIRYTLLPKWKQHQMNQLLSRSKSMLIPLQ